MKLLSDRILVEPIVVRMTTSGIHLPDSDISVFADGRFCRVLDVGPECKEVSIGDTAFVHSYEHGPDAVLPDGKLIVRERNVLLVITPKKV